MTENKDAIGQAILDYSKQTNELEIIVASDICDDDTIPVSYLFRSYDEMPTIEKLALARCEGKILDIGAAAGIHSSYLKSKGCDVSSIDISEGSVQYMQSIGLNAEVQDFKTIKDEKFDTLLLLMNGIGIAGSLDSLEAFLIHAKSVLSPNGKIICDSTDVQYLYEDDEGGMWVDLNTLYYGNFKFQMRYKEYTTDWFEWLYADFNSFENAAHNAGLTIELIHEEENQFLVELKHK